MKLSPRRYSAFLVRFLLALSLIYVASLLKVSVIIGSMSAFFSGISVALPLIGYYLGTASGGAAVTLKMLIHTLAYGLPPLRYLAYHIPGLFASASLQYAHWLIRCAIPLFCMFLFVMHPVGAASFPYALYWLIPVIIYVTKKSSLFYHALASTFVAHAVGSVIWIYADPMTPAVWLGLIPVVAVERLCFAAGITMMHAVIGYTMSFARKQFSYRLGLIHD